MNLSLNVKVMKTTWLFNYDISEVNINSEYKFICIFKNKIFKILNIQNKYLKVMLNGINTTINKKNCLFFPA